MEEAKEYALLSNLKHGMPLTRKEKRHVIEEFLKLHPERSNGWIAADLGTTIKTVNARRKELEEETGGQIDRLDSLIGKDGKEYPRTPYIIDDTRLASSHLLDDKRVEADKSKEHIHVEVAEKTKTSPATAGKYARRERIVTTFPVSGHLEAEVVTEMERPYLVLRDTLEAGGGCWRH